MLSIAEVKLSSWLADSGYAGRTIGAIEYGRRRRLNGVERFEWRTSRRITCSVITL